ncbi:HAD family phosphatase [Mucilaginibacter sp. PAMB04274]|uniref:HAD family hydrolase n=1 Tax=Mucilaginibacter sp. PAMB04274 TaxID=3138568 RepID=UPI0031F70FE7
MIQDSSPIKALLLDIGGIFLTNGWDRGSRKAAADHFNINFEEMNERHRIIFDAYESGKSTLDEYLNLLVFYESRPFTPQDFKSFMMGQSQPYLDMISLVTQLKQQYGLQTIAVNNEGKEINEYRIKQYNLKSFIDVFASSCIIQARKPDKSIYTTALDLLQIKPKEAIYLDDRLVFIQAAQQLGINTIHHINTETTRSAFNAFGLRPEAV